MSVLHTLTCKPHTSCHFFCNHAFVGPKKLLPTRICVDPKWFYCLDSDADLKRNILV